MVFRLLGQYCRPTEKRATQGILDMSTTVYYKQNRLKQLRAFCFAASSGSVSRAAERLFLSQPTVTLQIQALERNMDISLFERRGPSIKLTPQGEVLLRLAQPLVEGMTV